MQINFSLDRGSPSEIYCASRFGAPLGGVPRSAGEGFLASPGTLLLGFLRFSDHHLRPREGGGFWAGGIAGGGGKGNRGGGWGPRPPAAPGGPRGAGAPRGGG